MPPQQSRPNSLKQALENKLSKTGIEELEMSADFNEIYSDVERDKERVGSFNNSKEGLGFEAEAMIMEIMSRKVFGDDISFGKASAYDDMFHHVDGYLVNPHAKEPVVSAFDLTINQNNFEKASVLEAEIKGFEKKLKQLRAKVDRLSNIDPNTSRDFIAWMQAGGMKQKRPIDPKDLNYKNWQMADEFITIKYFKNPKDSDHEPGRPRPVLAGPQMVFSLDTMFINKLKNDRANWLPEIETLLRSEMYVAISLLMGYMDELVKRNPNRNSIFDAYYSATKAWAQILEDPKHKRIFEGAGIKLQNGKLETKKQFVYFMETYTKAFK